MAAIDQDLLDKCADIMGLETISPHEDFFGVGGDSLDAVEVCEMLRAELDRDVEVVTVLRSATFADMLASIRRLDNATE